MPDLIKLTARVYASSGYGASDQDIWINPSSVSSVQLLSTSVYYQYLITMHDGTKFNIHGKDKLKELGI
jgi:hypothetical protein